MTIQNKTNSKFFMPMGMTMLTQFFLKALLLLCIGIALIADNTQAAESSEQNIDLSEQEDDLKTDQSAMQDLGFVKLRSLDKITARTQTFEAKVGSTVQFGPLFIKVQACRKSSPIEEPESAAFIQVWEITPKEEAEWIFSGWMFASSPGLSSMDHPIYDVWVLDCLEKASDSDSNKSKDASADNQSNTENEDSKNGKNKIDALLKKKKE